MIKVLRLFSISILMGNNDINKWKISATNIPVINYTCLSNKHFLNSLLIYIYWDFIAIWTYYAFSLSCTSNISFMYQKWLALNSFRFDCATCPNSFCLASELRKHERLQHRPAASFACSTCGKTFGQKVTLEQHQVSEYRRETSQVVEPNNPVIRRYGIMRVPLS